MAEKISVYQAADKKGVTVQTVRNAIANKKLRTAGSLKIGPTREIELLDEKAVDAWQPQSRSRMAEKSVERAADLLGISVADAMVLRERKLAGGGLTKIQI